MDLDKLDVEQIIGNTEMSNIARKKIVLPTKKGRGELQRGKRKKKAESISKQNISVKRWEGCRPTQVSHIVPGGRR